MRGLRSMGLAIAIGASAAATAFAADTNRPAALPQAHDYQRVLRAYMGTLTAKDFDHGVTNLVGPQGSTNDPEYLYRIYIYTLMSQPLVGTKRGVPAVNTPPALFTLAAIETTNGVMRVPVYPEALMSFVQWDHAGNPFHDSRALKLRAFVSASVNLMMFDDHLERTPSARRSDWSGYQLVCAAMPYLGFRDLLPTNVRQAFEAGLLKLARQIIAYGPRAEEPHMDMTVPVGLWYASRACHDPQLAKEAEDYARKLLADPGHFHPAGYHVERGGLDVGFAGMANWFTCWLALATDWPFARDAVERSYRLRSHLMLPEPDGKLTGPTHFNTRLDTPASADQWDFANREHGAAMITDEAAWMVKMPTPEQLSNAPAARASAFNGQLNENPRAVAGQNIFQSNAEIVNSPWRHYMWPSWNFPASVNFSYELCRTNAYAHRLELEKARSPLLQSPFLRDGTFVRDFAGAFVVAKQPTYSVILHTGPVGRQDLNDGLYQFNGPLGFGGGQLSAFWTPRTGSIILGRRRGMHWDQSFDTNAAWRLWPIHAVSGCTPEGKVFTSARILNLAVTNAIAKDRSTAQVSGSISGDQLGQTNVLAGALGYRRMFTIGEKSLRVETHVSGDGKDRVSELYETIPVFLRDLLLNTNVPVTIEFQVGGKWVPATADYQAKVKAVKLTRYSGAVQISFDQPQRVKLSPAEWADTFITRAICRNVMIDLLNSGGQSEALLKARTVKYEIAPIPK